MLFSSITFLYFFLPIVLLLYGAVSHRGGMTSKNLVLCAASCFFYAWGEPAYVFLMLAQILLVYVLTAFTEKKSLFFLSVFVPFASLFYFKYLGFVMKDLLPMLPWKAQWLSYADNITLPIGISFYTFQLTSYCIDVWRGRVKRQKSLLSLATYVTLFPQLIAGPIVRYSDIEKELSKRSAAGEDVSEGIVRFAVGLGKKVLIANVLGEFVAEVMALPSRSLLLSWGYAAAVALQLYYDFSGYSDMAIGLGRMFGFHFPENFNYPFISGSLTEFWRRWHMTLGAWFRDYVYIPMGGNRVSTLRWCFNLLTVWFLTGLWHGAGWTFICWGLFFGVMLALEKIIGKHLPGKMLWRVLRHIYVIIAVIVSFLIFHGENMAAALSDIRSLLPGASSANGELSSYLLRNRLGILVLSVLGATPLPAFWWKRFFARLHKETVEEAAKALGVLALLLISTAYLIDGSFNPFLYFRF